jgi:hypothetical protein
VEYGKTTAYGTLSALESNLLTNHNQNLSGLTADTIYYFRVRSKDSAGQEVISSGASFKTAAVIVVPPPTGKVVAFNGGSASAFVTLCKDLTIDVIEMAGGTYPGWAAFLDVDRTSAHPLLIRPKAGAAVVWDGTGTTNTPPFRIGWSTKASYITFDPAGTGGSFTAQNYKLGKAGLIMGRYFDHLTFNGLIVRNVEGGFGDGIPGQQQHTHAVYIMGGDGKNWTSNDWDVVGPANKMLNGFQTDGAPNADGLIVKGWKVSSLNRAVYAWSDPTGYVIDGWDIADCNVTIDNNKGQQAAKGVVKNCKAVRSGPLTPGQGWWGSQNGLVDGGGNTSS